MENEIKEDKLTLDLSATESGQITPMANEPGPGGYACCVGCIGEVSCTNGK